ncbi:hypothetical protein [Actinomadura sp. 9N407]|uniref:hypothetical protein n=1 Tax=Actinomadura sp. 9N407 TaxID=3375154 RepID=UPI00379BDDD2
MAITALLTYLNVSADPTEGLDYASDDTPEEMSRSICYSDSGPCPPTGFTWKIPPSGVVQTLFRREDIDERTQLRGWFRLKASTYSQEKARDCPAVVDWSLLVDGKPIGQGTITAGSKDQEVTGTPPRQARFISFSARRTDSLACHSTLQWIYAGLD